MKKVRFLTWALCVLMLLTIVPIATNAAPGADGSVTITATASSLMVGETADVSFTVNAQTDPVGAVNFTVSLPAGLEYVSHTIDVAMTDFMMSAYTPATGVFGCGVTMTGKTGSFKVLTIKVKAKDTGVGINNIGVILGNMTKVDGSTKMDFGTVTPCVIVTSAPVINVTGVTLDKTTADINIGGTATLVATVAPANATNKKVIFTSSDPTVATVDASGNVIGLKEGNVTITATTEDGGKTATCAVKVTCAHNFNKKDESNPAAVKVEGTCKQAAVYYYFCSVCSVRGGDTNTYEGEKVATNHKGTKLQPTGDEYLVNPGATCQEFKKYYYQCGDCQQKLAETWTSTTLGEHAYGELVQAKEEVHTVDKLEPAVAAHHKCSVCQTYFTEGKVATTLQALTGATPAHTYGAFKADAQNHWKECSCTKKDSEGKHIFDNDADMICDTCQYDRSCTHSKPLTHVEAKPATCTVDGNIEYWYCVDCLAKFDSATATNKLTNVVVTAPGHIFDTTKYTYADGYHWNVCTGIGCTETTAKVACDSAVKATCQQKAVCDTCGNTYTDFAPHDYATEYTTEAGKHWRACKTANCVAVTDEANCSGGTATCYKLAECATCNKEYGTLAAHVISTTWNYKDATGHAYACTNTGCTYHEDTQDHVADAAGETCTVCKYVYHTCGVGETTYVAPVIGSCMVKGRPAYYQCSCGKLYYDEAATRVLNSLSDIEAYGAHSGVVTPAIPATCTTPGATESMSCSVCRMQFGISQVIPATGHSFGEWTTTLEPTDFVEGSKSRTCSNCNEVETEAIPALGHEHTPVELPAVAPTATETGLTAGSKCATCEEILVAQEIIPALGEIVIETPAEEGEESSVIIAGTGIAVGTKVEVTYKPAEEFANVSVTVEGKQGSILQVADITLELEGNKVQPDGSVQVKLLINEALRTLENLEVVYIAADGTVEVMNAVREGNYLVFDAKHFSNYAVVELKEEVVTEPEETTQAPEETTAAPEETTAAPEETTQAPEETTQAPEETTAAPEETTAAPEETTQAPEDITVPEETTEAPVETTEAPEETTAAPEETTSPEVPSTGDNAIFFIVALIAFSAIFTVVVTISKKRNDN